VEHIKWKIGKMEKIFTLLSYCKKRQETGVGEAQKVIPPSAARNAQLFFENRPGRPK
jgi:hypothetical protein